MKDVKNIQIAYIGGGSRAWAHNLMNDLAQDEEIGGTLRPFNFAIRARKRYAKSRHFWAWAIS